MLNQGLAVLTFLFIALSYILAAHRNKYWIVVQILFVTSNLVINISEFDMVNGLVNVALISTLLYSLTTLNKDFKVDNYNGLKVSVLIYILILTPICIFNVNDPNVTQPIMESVLMCLPVPFIFLLVIGNPVGWIVGFIYFLSLSVIWFMQYMYESYLVYTGMHAVLGALCIYGFYMWFDEGGDIKL